MGENKHKEILEGIGRPSDVQNLSLPQLELLVEACRARIVEATSVAGGHLASSLGTVELTAALFYVFNAEKDRFVWDVGHQGYTHKILTGRSPLLDQIGVESGIGKFLRREESPYDIFGAGHASTSISAALGVAVGQGLRGEKHKTVAIIGDGGLTGGLSYEAMNHAGHLKKDLIVVLNDNDMSIDPNVGALSKTFNAIQTSHPYNKIREELNHFEKQGKFSGMLVSALKRIDHSLMEFLSPGAWFEKLGFRYFGPIDGHDLAKVVELLQKIKMINEPVLVHLLTVKGKGYLHAENNSLKYHGVTPFDPENGKFTQKTSQGKAFTKIWSETFTQVMENDQQVAAVSAAMIGSTGLKDLQEKHPERVFDVGIAEGHAVTFSAGLCVQGFKPFVTIYSTFLQRAIDHIIHDVALQNLPVRFILDRAGFVGADGATHHGVFDLTYLRMIPNMVLMTPKDGRELQQMILTAYEYDVGPIALRFPRGETKVYAQADEAFAPLPLGKGELLKSGKHLLILAVGVLVDAALTLSELLSKEGISCSVVNARFIKPLDENLIVECVRSCQAVITLEENVLKGGFGSAILELMAEKMIQKPIKTFGVPDFFIEYGTPQQQRGHAHLLPEQLLEQTREFLIQAIPKSLTSALLKRSKPE